MNQINQLLKPPLHLLFKLGLNLAPYDREDRPDGNATDITERRDG
jgi:hypothetical protein